MSSHEQAASRGSRPISEGSESSPEHRQRRSLGIIGLGSFGRFMAQHLAPHFDLLVCDRHAELEAEADRLGLRWSSLAECASCDVIVPSVPVQDLERVVRQAAPSVRSGALWVDVASVKVRPIDLMLRLLPSDCRLVATHPMFGPQSGRDGIAGLKIVLCPVRGSSGIRTFLEQQLALQVLEMSAEEHDRQIAYIQGLTHWVARAIREIHMPDLELATPAYRHLLSIEEILRQDSDALFLTIQRENPFAAAARRELRVRLAELEQWIDDEGPDADRE